MAHYTTYWRDDQVDDAIGKPIDSAASQQFEKVRKGDTVWIVNIQTGTGTLRLVGRVLVDAVVDRQAMERRYPDRQLFEAEHYVCAPPGVAEMGLPVPIDHYAPQIRFEGPSPTLQIRNGKVYHQQVRSLRILTPETAQLFEDIWLDFNGAVEVPPTGRYVQELGRLGDRIKPMHRRLLALQYAAHGRQTSTRFLADAACDGNIGTANLFYGGLAKDLCEALGVEPSRRRDGSPRWWNILATGWDGPDGFVWKMRPEVAEALEILGWVSPGTVVTAATPLDGEEQIGQGQYEEGRVRQVLVNAYERDREAREACIAHYSYKCQICEFDFSMAYRGLGKGFIHVHHRVPLAQIGAAYKVDPIKDLIPVCPNCHAMLHYGDNPPTVEALQGIVRSGR